MRVSFFVGLATVALLGAVCLWIVSGEVASDNARTSAIENTPVAPRAGQATAPVVVELFTSEGCSSCPPADRLLARLDQSQPVVGAQIIALEQHVDYWNSDGWMDPFSSALFTQRQSGYVRALHADTAYTPQMVVDGAAEFVGSDERYALAAIARSARTSKTVVVLKSNQGSKPAPDSAPLSVRVDSITNGKSEYSADVLLAITEDGLSSNVTRGENAGAQLNHRAVVREMRILGAVKSDGSFSADLNEPLAKNWKRESLRAVVFVQDRASRHILGAASLPLSIQ